MMMLAHAGIVGGITQGRLGCCYCMPSACGSVTCEPCCSWDPFTAFTKAFGNEGGRPLSGPQHWQGQQGLAPVYQNSPETADVAGLGEGTLPGGIRRGGQTWAGQDPCELPESWCHMQATWVAMYGEEWGAMHARLQGVMQTAIQGYWQRFQDEASTGIPAAVAPAIQVHIGLLRVLPTSCLIPTHASSTPSDPCMSGKHTFRSCKLRSLR